LSAIAYPEVMRKTVILTLSDAPARAGG